MERNVQKNSLVNLAAALIFFIGAFVVAGYAGSLSGKVGAIFLGISALVSFVSWFQMRLEESERQEKFEVEELAGSRGESALFESKDAELFAARRGREQFERFFVPAFTVLLMLIEAGCAYWLWRSLSKVTNGIVVDRAMSALALFAIFALLLFLIGRFSATVARLKSDPLLRPSASYLLLCAYICFTTALGIALVRWNFPQADLYIARGFCVLLGLMAVETLIALLLEMYRPRVKGKAARPLYDSRLVGLLGQPESLFTTAAQALDYQFGFKVSDTWFFKVAQKYLAMFLIAQLVVLLLSTCVVFIDAGEQGVLERFGKPVEGRMLLDAGAHLKLPWPIDHVYRYRTEQIQSFNVGYNPDPRLAGQKTIVWTIAHGETNFLVANRLETTLADTNNPDTSSDRKAPPVGLLSVSIPVHYQIKDLPAWVYNNEDSGGLLQDIAWRAVVSHLVGSDLNETLSQGRLEAADILKTRIQADADARKLGVKILFVGLQDIHPPVTVAPDYEKVVSAVQQMIAITNTATANAIGISVKAGGEAYRTLQQADAEREQRMKSAAAEVELFTNRIPSFVTSPSYYAQRLFFETFVRATAQARKYIMLTTNTQDVFIYDLQDKVNFEDPITPEKKTP